MLVQRFGKSNLEVQTVATVKKMSDIFPEVNMIGAAYILAGKTVSISIKVNNIEYISSLSEKKVTILDKDLLKNGEVVYEIRLQDDIYFLYEDWLENIHEESYEVSDIFEIQTLMNKSDRIKYNK